MSRYRQRTQLEQYFRDGKQYFALDSATVTMTEGLLLAGLRAFAVSAASVFVGEARTAAVGYRVLPGHAGTDAQMTRLACPLESGYARARRTGNLFYRGCR